MIFIRRDAEGAVVAASREPVEGEGWTAVASDDEAVVAFGRRIADSANPMNASDLPLVRVLEDLIDLLIERSVIRFTDLPQAAQHKLMERRGAREALQHAILLDDDGVI